MKALVVTPYYFPKHGGLETYARQLGIALKELKHWEIVVVTSGDFGSGVSQERIDGMKLYRLSRWLKLSNTPVNPFWPVQIKKIIKIEQPDLIVAHTPVPSMSDSAALAAGKTPFVLIYHAATLLKDGATMFNLIAKIYAQFEKISLHKASRVIVVSEYVKQQMPAQLQEKTEVLPNSIWGDQISVRKTQPSTPEFLFIGSLNKSHAWKGLDQILEAVDIYKNQVSPDVKLKIMGEGDDLSNYQKLVKDLGISKSVEFLGPVHDKRKDQIISRSTALIVYPTTSNDAFPTVFLEAWAKGVPVISASIGPIPSLIKDYKSGYLVLPSNPNALAEKMAEVVSLRATSRQAVAKFAGKRTASKFTWEKQAEKFSNIVEESVV